MWTKMTTSSSWVFRMPDVLMLGILAAEPSGFLWWVCGHARAHLAGPSEIVNHYLIPTSKRKRDSSSFCEHKYIFTCPSGVSEGSK